MRKDKIPTPELVTSKTAYGTAYAWAIDGFGLRVYGNSKAQAINDFKEAYLFEYGKNI